MVVSIVNVADITLAVMKALAASSASYVLDLADTSSRRIPCLSSACVGSVGSPTNSYSSTSREADDVISLHLDSDLFPTCESVVICTP